MWMEAGLWCRAGFSFYGPGQPFGIMADDQRQLESCNNYSINVESNAFTLGPHNAGHPLTAGVTTLNSNPCKHSPPSCRMAKQFQKNLTLPKKAIQQR